MNRRAAARLWVGAGLATWTAAWFGSALWGGSLLYFRDLIQYHYPARRFWVEEIRRGSWPLWDPYSASGTPFLANPNNLSLYPLSWIQAFLPFDAAFNWTLILTWLLAQAGVYRLARRLGAGRVPALLAALACGGSGYGVSALNLPNLLVAAAAAPWMGWAALGIARRAAPRDIASFGAATALCLLGGEPIALAISLAGCGVLILAGGGPSVPLRRRAAAALAGAGLGALLAAPLLLPAVEMLRGSERGQGLAEEVRGRWELTPFEAAAMALPRLGGDPTRYDPERNWSRQLHGTLPLLLSTYAGIPLLLLAAIGWCGLAPRNRILTGAGMIICLAAAAGRALSLFPALDLFGPLSGGVRYPSKFLLGVFLLLSVLSGFGLQRLREGGRLPVTLRALPLASALALAALLAADLGSSGTLTSWLCERIAVAPAGREAAVRGFRWSAGSALLLSLTAASLAGFLRRRLRPLAAATAWILLVAGDLWAAQAPVVPRAAAQAFQARPLFAERLGDGERLFREERPPGFALRSPDARPIWGYVWDRATLARGTAAEARIVNVLERPVDYLWPATTARLRRWALEAPPDRQARILRRLGVTAWLSFQDAPIPGTELLASETDLCHPPLRFRRILDPLPSAFWTAAYGVAADDAVLREALGAERGPDVWIIPPPDPRDLPLDGLRGGLEGAPGGGRSRGRCETVERRPNRVELRCEGERSGLAVSLDTWAPGWELRVDGVESASLRVNGAYRGALLSSGRHAVVWRYRPRSAGVGRILGLAGIGILAIAASIRPGPTKSVSGM